MDSTMRFRSSTMRAVGVAAMGFAAVGLGSLAIEGSVSDVVTLAGPLGLVALFGYAALWAAYVDIDDGGVEMRNVLRTVRIAWPAVEDVEGRYGLRLRTAYGRYTAWAAPAPAGRDRARGADSEAAVLVRDHLQRLRAAGHLDNPRLEFNRPAVTWHVAVIAVGSALLLLTVLAPLLG